MRLSGMDGSNTMSREMSSQQWQFRQAVPYSKYLNCRNHKLALILFQRIKVASSCWCLLSFWKMMKCSSAKSTTFKEARNLENQRSLKILKAAPMPWLSHSDASKRVIASFGHLVNALVTLYNVILKLKVFRKPFQILTL